MEILIVTEFRMQVRFNGTDKWLNLNIQINYSFIGLGGLWINSYSSSALKLSIRLLYEKGESLILKHNFHSGLIPSAHIDYSNAAHTCLCTIWALVTNCERMYSWSKIIKIVTSKDCLSEWYHCLMLLTGMDGLRPNTESKIGRSV